MRQLTIFGGSGATGRVLIRRAVEREVRIRALVRHPGNLRLPKSVEVLEGELSSDARIDSAISGSDAVIILFGPRPPYTDIFCQDATRRIVSSMKRNGLRRLICQTGAMVGDYPANRTRPFRLMVELFNRRMPELAKDREEQEKEVMESGLDWTIVKPPKLTDGNGKGKWVAGRDVRVGLLSSITREDLAGFILGEVFHDSFGKNAIFIRN